MLEKRISAAHTLAKLQSAGQLFGELREKGKLAHNEIARLRIVYDTKLDALERHDPDNPLRRSVTSLGDSEEDINRKSLLLEAKAPHEQHHPESHTSITFEEDDTFIRAHVELLLPSIEVPQLQEGPVHIRDRSLLVTASKVVYTNTPRCAKVSDFGLLAVAAAWALAYRLTSHAPMLLLMPSVFPRPSSSSQMTLPSFRKCTQPSCTPPKQASLGWRRKTLKHCQTWRSLRPHTKIKRPFQSLTGI
jgi:hypothetical protein